MNRFGPRRNGSGQIIQGGLDMQPVHMQKKPNSPRSSHYRAIVANTYVSDSEDNQRSLAVECDVILVASHIRLMSVPVMQAKHGINNAADLWIPHPSTRVLSSQTTELNLTGVTSDGGRYVGPVTPFDDVDGDMVLVSFMEGNPDFPIIVGAISHAQSKRTVVEGDGWVEGDDATRGTAQSRESYRRHAGTETRVNADGDYLIDTVGATNDEVDEDPASGGGQVRLRVKDTERLTVEMDGEDVLEVWKDGSQVRIDLGEGATEKLLLGDTFKSYLDDFITEKFNKHTHTYTWTDLGGSGTTATTLALGTTVPDSALSDLVKAKKS